MPNPNPKIENLIPFTGGYDPRRGHAKRGVPHSSTRLKRLLELTENLTNPITGEVEGFTVADQIDLAQIIKARKGDTHAYNALLDRLEGKPKQTEEVNLKGRLTLVDLVKQVVKDEAPTDGQPEQE